MVGGLTRFLVCSENRPFDHYYGTLKGVRGFNDRTAPPLPNGKPVWYQPYKQLPKVVPLCGCNVCDVKWTIAGDVLKDTIMSMPCAVLAQDLAGAVPPVHITQGEACSTFLSSFRNTSYDHIPLGDLIEPNPTCPSGAKITGLRTLLPAAGVVACIVAHTWLAAASVADEVDPAQNITSKYILPFNLQFNDTSAQCMPGAWLMCVMVPRLCALTDCARVAATYPQPPRWRTQATLGS